MAPEHHRRHEHRTFGVVGAAQFLTRVPIRTDAPTSRTAMLPWFPVVGALVGAVVGGTAAGLSYWLTPFAAAAVAVAAGMLLTGAFHEDGLADLADAIPGGATRARRFEILTDSRLGTYGTAALCSSILIRVAAVGSLASVGPAVTVAAVLAAHALARGVAAAAIGFVPPAAPSARPAGPADPTARPARLGASFGSDVSPLRAAATLAMAMSIGVVAIGWWIGPLAATALAGAALVTVVAVRALGGTTGDVAGAVEQVAEIAALLVASAIATHHQLWWR